MEGVAYGLTLWTRTLLHRPDTRARPKYVVEQPTKPYSLTPFLPTRHHPKQNEGEGGVEIVYAPESIPRKHNIQSTTSYFLSPFGLQRGRRAAPTWSEPRSSALAGTRARSYAGRPRRAFSGRSGRITSRWRPTNAPHFTERCGPMQHKRKQCFGAAWGAAFPSDNRAGRTCVDRMVAAGKSWILRSFERNFERLGRGP